MPRDWHDASSDHFSGGFVSRRIDSLQDARAVSESRVTSDSKMLNQKL